MIVTMVIVTVVFVTVVIVTIVIVTIVIVTIVILAIVTLTYGRLLEAAWKGENDVVGDCILEGPSTPPARPLPLSPGPASTLQMPNAK